MLRLDLNKMLEISLKTTTSEQASAAEKLHRRGPKTVLAQTAEITKYHVIFIVFFKF